MSVLLLCACVQVGVTCGYMPSAADQQCGNLWYDQHRTSCSSIGDNVHQKITVENAHKKITVENAHPQKITVENVHQKILVENAHPQKITNDVTGSGDNYDSDSNVAWRDLEVSEEQSYFEVPHSDVYLEVNCCSLLLRCSCPVKLLRSPEDHMILWLTRLVRLLSRSDGSDSGEHGYQKPPWIGTVVHLLRRSLKVRSRHLCSDF